MNQGLKRSPTNKVIAGVCGGLAEHLRLDSTLVRLIFVLLGVFALGGLIVYIVLWVIIPEGNYYADEAVNESQPIENENVYQTSQNGKGQLFIGVTLITIGALLLIGAFIPKFSLLDFWPLALIALGVVILNQTTKKV